MMLTSIYHILTNNVAFDENLYAEYYHKATQKFKNLSVSKVVEFLTQKGFSITDLSSGQVFSLSV